jgi:hypothetical protein
MQIQRAGVPEERNSKQYYLPTEVKSSTVYLDVLREAICKQSEEATKQEKRRRWRRKRISSCVPHVRVSLSPL